MLGKTDTASLQVNATYCMGFSDKTHNVILSQKFGKKKDATRKSWKEKSKMPQFFALWAFYFISSHFEPKNSEKISKKIKKIFFKID